MSKATIDDDEEDPQFLRDLEEAKRRSMESPSSSSSSFSMNQSNTTKSHPAFAAFPMAQTPQTSSYFGISSQPPPIGFPQFIAPTNGNNSKGGTPPPPLFSTFPHLNHTSINGNNNNSSNHGNGVILKGPNGNGNNVICNVSRSQSYPFGISTTTSTTPNNNNNPVPFAFGTLTKTSQLPCGLYPTSSIPNPQAHGVGIFQLQNPNNIIPGLFSSTSTNSSSSYSYNFPNHRQSLSSQSDSGYSAGNKSILANLQRRNTASSPPELPAIKKDLGESLYKELREEVRRSWNGGDLIDLGQDDGTNVLEAFDPLFDKPRIGPNPQSALVTHRTPTERSLSVSPAKEEMKVQIPKLPKPGEVEAIKRSSSSSQEEEGKGKVMLGFDAFTSSSEIVTTAYKSLAEETEMSNSNQRNENSEDKKVEDWSAAYGEEEDNDDVDDKWNSNSNPNYDGVVPLYPTLPPSESDPSVLYDAYNLYQALDHAPSDTSSSVSYYGYGSTGGTSSETASGNNRSSDTTSKRSADYIRSHSHRKHSKSKRRGKLYEDITSLQKVAENDGELMAFVNVLQRIKTSVQLSSKSKVSTYITSATGPSNCYEKGLSLKVTVWNETFTTDPVTFTSDVNTPVDVVIAQALTKMEVEESESSANYLARVKGLNEFLDSSCSLIEHRYVQDCIKFDEDISIVLVSRVSIMQNAGRHKPEDLNIQPDDIMPTCQSKVITFTEISKFLEVIDSESDKLNEKVNSNASLNASPLIQTVKGICVLLGDIQTVEIRRSLNEFVKGCESWNAELQKTKEIHPQTSTSSRRAFVGSDASSRHSYVEIVPNKGETTKDLVLRTKENVIESVRSLVEMYSTSFPVSFQMNSPLEQNPNENNEGPKSVGEMLDPFVVRLGALHRIKADWTSSIYADYFVTAEAFHGTRLMGKQTSCTAPITKMGSDDNLFFSQVIFDTWMDFEHLPVCILPKECRLVFSVYGRKYVEGNPLRELESLGWASIQCFDFQGHLARGHQLLPLWPPGMPQKRLGPAPNSAFSYDLNVPLITIELPDFGHTLKFPDVPLPNHVVRDFQSLDANTQLQLKDIIENYTFTKGFQADDREILWEKRHYLHTLPKALPKVLLAAPLWDFASLSELHRIMDDWAPLPPQVGLQLLLPCYPDEKVRQKPLKWIGKMNNGDLVTIIPQLVEALSYETFDLSSLAEFILKKSLLSFEVAHALFWNLVSEVGLGKWGSDCSSDTIGPPAPFMMTTACSDEQTDPRRRRLELMRNSLMAVSCHKWKQAFINEFKLVQGLCDVTTMVKLAHPSQRSSVMSQELKQLDVKLFGAHTIYTLPLSPAISVTGIDVDTCICFNSASVPLKINFKSGLPEGGNVPILYKQGDDIRQDMLTIQVIRTIESWWRKEGLDLRVTTFTCVPTGFKQGIVEIVPNAETLCKIQAEYGLAGAFKKRPIAEWLAKMNPSTLDYRRAVENFTRSCAAYCVLTYILGVCDRHNDNIMLTTRGHLFHIDFGKFLGDAQMFGSFRRDRTAFVLTSDMLFVINGGEKESQRYHEFVELCCKAFSIVRQNGNILMNFFLMMATAGIPGVDINSVQYIERSLLPEFSNVEAAARFTRCIEDSLNSWFTSVNFFIHSFAQRISLFSSDSNDNPSTLSFIPRMYSMDSDGRIELVTVTGFKKKYGPDKYYSYSIKVKRRAYNEPSYVHRSYKQFVELYSKLCINFPIAERSLKALPRRLALGRSNIKQVAERRMVLLQAFLDSLFTLADEISHSDLVYTFFHPLLQDEGFIENEQELTAREERALLNPVKIHGGLDVSIAYKKGILEIFVRRAFDLSCPNGEPPSPYVKCYLQPDHQKVTKRKTETVKRSQHPTFMALLKYELPRHVILSRTLEISVWHHDNFQENNFLGGVCIPLNQIQLDQENTHTYLLRNLTVTS